MKASNWCDERHFLPMRSCPDWVQGLAQGLAQAWLIQFRGAFDRESAISHNHEGALHDAGYRRNVKSRAGVQRRAEPALKFFYLIPESWRRDAAMRGGAGEMFFFGRRGE